MGTTNTPRDLASPGRKAPTVKQMVARSLPVHRHILASIADGTGIASPTARGSEIRGYKTALQTLKRWRCIEVVGANALALTDGGRALLEALGGAP